MAQPQVADAHSVDPDVWLCCAAPNSRLPPGVGSQVYYLPQWHAEQCTALLPAPLPRPHIYPCTVHAVDLCADAESDEPYAAIALTPGPHRRDTRDDANPNPGARVVDPGFRYHAKELSKTDAKSSFWVPKSCADSILPKLNVKTVQNLCMRDLLGVHWNFRYVCYGPPRRQLLSTGWNEFVNAKRLGFGDDVVFIHRPNGELAIGVRRKPRYVYYENPVEPPRNALARVPPQEVLDSVRDAAKGSKFTVTYYPRKHASEFVLPRKEVEDAMDSAWEPGMQMFKPLFHLSNQGPSSIGSSSHVGICSQVVKTAQSSTGSSSQNVKIETPPSFNQFVVTKTASSSSGGPLKDDHNNQNYCKHET